MAKSIKRNVIVSALLAICLCVSLIAGATFAIFTSQSSVNIAVTSGKVKVEATISELKAYSPKTIASDGSLVDDTNTATKDGEEWMFGNGGTAVYDEENNKLELDKLTPGDKVTFKITVKNLSNVKAKYRTLVAMAEGSDEVLFGALAFNVGGREMIGKSDWSDLAPAANADGDDVTTYECSVELPGAVTGEEYMEKSCAIVFTIEAVQGNADTAEDILTAEELLATYGNDGINMPEGVVITAERDPEGSNGSLTTVTLKDYEAFVYFTQVFNYKKAYEARKALLENDPSKLYPNEHPNNIWYTGYIYKLTVKLDCDIDLKDASVNPFLFTDIGNSTFTFDGNGHSIKNAKLASSTGNVAFFGNGVSVKNVTLDNIHVTATGNPENQCAGIVSSDANTNIANVIVKNSSVVGGKFTGAIVGYNYGSITNCTVLNCTVSGQYKVGGVVGYICNSNNGETCVTGNKLTNVTVKAENVLTGKTAIIGKFVGNWNATVGTCNDNTFSGTTVAVNNIGKIEGGCAVTE